MSSIPPSVGTGAGEEAGDEVRKPIASSLFRSSATYATANLINAAVPFVLLPILTRYLGPAEYGMIALFQALTGISGAFVGLSVHGAVNRQFMRKDELDFPQYVGNCLFILLGSTFLTGALTLAFAEAIERWTSFPGDWLWAIILFSAAQFAVNIRLIVWQMDAKPMPYAAFQMLYTGVLVALTLLLVIGAGFGWQGRVSAQVIAITGFGAAGVVLLARSGWLRLRPQREYLRHALAFGVPLIPHALGSFVIMLGDRLFVARMVGIEQTGIYSVAIQIGMILLIVQNSFHQAWIPWLYRQLKQEDRHLKVRVVKFTYVYFGSALASALALGSVAPYLLAILAPPQYQGAAPLVLWIALGYAFNGMYKMVGNYVFYVEKPHVLSVITLVTVAVSIISNYVLISRFGILGAAQATTVTFLTSFVLVWIASARLYPMPYLLKA